MLTGLILPIICKKYKISCILFTKEFEIVEFTDNLNFFASDESALNSSSDIRDSFWEFVGIEEKLEDLYTEKKDYIHIPMLSREDSFYDVNIEICSINANEKLFVAIFTKQSKDSMNYFNMIQKINHETLYNENHKEDMKNNQIYYNLINQKLISFHINQKGVITELNRACASFFGLDPRDIINHHFSDFFFSREIKDSSTDVSSILRAVDLNGIDVFFHTDIIPISSDGDLSESIIICQDITYLKRIESELEYAVHHDSLTGLPNRAMLQKKIEECILKNENTKESFALCFIDLNKFKRVNDEHGHHVGDMLLKHVGDILTNIIRECDTIARIGGDEFVILFEHLESTEYLESTLKRIEEISKKTPLLYNEDLTIPLSFSFGVSIYPKDGEDIESLLSSADEKMYKNKRIRV